MTRRLLLLLVGTLAAGTLAGSQGCFSPGLSDTSFACQNDDRCPAGFVCGSDGCCHRQGTPTDTFECFTVRTPDGGDERDGSDGPVEDRPQPPTDEDSGRADRDGRDGGDQGGDVAGDRADLTDGPVDQGDIPADPPIDVPVDLPLDVRPDVQPDLPPDVRPDLPSDPPADLPPDDVPPND